MDNQLKRGLLDVCVLAAIRDRDSYGYQMIKDMKPYLDMSESTLYTILKRLESAEMLTVRSVAFDGRLRKYYHITERGIARLGEFREDWNEMLAIYRFITRETRFVREDAGGAAAKSSSGQNGRRELPFTEETDFVRESR